MAQKVLLNDRNGIRTRAET